MYKNNEFIKKQISDTLNAHNPNTIEIVQKGGTIAFVFHLNQPKKIRDSNGIFVPEINPNNLVVTYLSAKLENNTFVWDEIEIGENVYKVNDFLTTKHQP